MQRRTCQGGSARRGNASDFLFPFRKVMFSVFQNGTKRENALMALGYSCGFSLFLIHKQGPENMNKDQCVMVLKCGRDSKRYYATYREVSISLHYSVRDDTYRYQCSVLQLSLRHLQIHV